MMKIKAYMKKYEVASKKITNEMTVGEVREVERARKSLWKFWLNYGEDMHRGTKNDPQNWVDHRITGGNLKPTGKIIVTIYNGDPMSRAERVNEYTIDKKKALTPKK